jgi:biotin carboxyl carrier protein
MREALNGFVIRGISSNIPFQAALLAHPKFVAGDFNTGFIAEHYGKGFQAEDVPHDDPSFLVALAAYVQPPRARALGRHQRPAARARASRWARTSWWSSWGRGQARAAPGVGVRLPGKTGSSVVDVGGKRYKIAATGTWAARASAAPSTASPSPRRWSAARARTRWPAHVAQRHADRGDGAVAAGARTACADALQGAAGPEQVPAVADAGPAGRGAVQPGQKVQAGEKLAVIEAMKMENVLFATQDGVVGKVLAAKGESLAVDMLEPHHAQQLKAAGLDYYNHNLDTAPEYYTDVVDTRTYQDRLDTLAHVRSAGISVCCGGIVGMGEAPVHRAGLIAQLANLNPYPESVPINSLVRVPGTPLADSEPVDPFDFVRMIAVARITMPTARVRLSAGRQQLGDAVQALCFMAGANSIFYGDKLLVTGNPDVEADVCCCASWA